MVTGVHKPRSFKSLLVAPLRMVLKATAGARESLRRLHAHASLAADIKHPLPASVVVLGRPRVYGTGAVSIGKDGLLYPGLYLETQDPATISIGDGLCCPPGSILWRWRASLSGTGP